MTGIHNAGDPFIINLSAGEAYQLRTTEGAGSDLTGTRIFRAKPVAVFGGHACANIRSSDAAFCGLRGGTTSASEPMGYRVLRASPGHWFDGDTIRVLAAFDNTIVSVNGAAVANPASGQFYESVHPSSIAVTGTQITANHPVLVAQAANSSDFDVVLNSDPFMSLVPGRALYSAQHKFCVPGSGFLTHHINVIAPTAFAGTVQLDGVAIGGFSPIAATGFSEATKPVAPGVHTVTAAQPVGVNLYGWQTKRTDGQLAFSSATQRRRP